MRAPLVPVASLSPAEADAWEDLARHAFEESFLEPDGYLPAVRHLEAYRRAQLARVHDGDRLVAALPFVGPEPWQGLAGPVATPERFPYVIGGGPPLLDAERPAEALGALLALLGRSRPPGILLLQRLDEDSATTRLVLEVCARTRTPAFVVERWERAVLARDALGGRWDAGISKERRRQLDRRRRRLAEHLGGPVELVDRVGDTGALEDFLRLEASGWKGRAGSAFASDGSRAAFLQAWYERQHARGRLHMFFLGRRDRWVAVQCALRQADRLVLFRTGYDDAYSRFGPGVLLTAALAEHFATAMDVAYLDSTSDPGNEHYLGLLPGRRTSLHLAVGVGSTRARFEVRARALAADPRVEAAIEPVRPIAGRLLQLAVRGRR